MISVSTAVRELIDAGRIPDFRALLTYASGTSETLNASRFLSGSPVIKKSVSAEGVFTVGGAVIGSFNFFLMNDDGHFDSADFAGARIVPQVGYNGTWYSLGTYYLASHKTAGSVIMCTACDSLALLDIAEFTETWPVTFLQAAQAICTRHGLTLASTSFAGAGMEFSKPGEVMTDRMVLAYMGQCTGNHVRMNAAGQMVIARSTGDSKTVSSVFDANLQTAALNYTGVRITPYGSDTATLYGAEGNVLSISDNPLITDAAAVGAMLWGNVGFITVVNAAGYTAGEADILSDFTIEPGDVLTINGKSLLVTNLTYKLGVREKVAFDAEDPIANDLRKSNAETFASAISSVREIANDAEKTATNYIIQDSSGLMIAELNGSGETPSTATTKNVFIDSSSVKIRDGQDVLATFEANLIELGDEGAEIALCGGNGIIKYDNSLGRPFQILGDENILIGTQSRGITYVSLVGSSNYSGIDLFAEEIGLTGDTLHILANSLGTGYDYDMANVVNAIPVTLYDNASASASSNATLNETAANFKRLTIFFKDNDGNHSSVDVWSPNGKRVSLSLTWINGASTQEMYQRVRWVTISGTTISTYKGSSDTKYRTGQVKLGATASVTNSDYISIVHVIGYR